MKEEKNKQTVQEEVVTDTEATEETVQAETEVASEAEVLDANEVVAEFENRYKRLQADFENFKRRTAQEKTQLATFIKGDIVKDFLPVLDNFERALGAEVSTPEMKAFLDGFVMIQQTLMAMLSKHGLAVIEAEGQPFDPNYHQAVMRVSDSDAADDTVLEVLQTGYTVDGRTLRPAMVKVASNG